MNQKVKAKIIDVNLPPHKRFKALLSFTESTPDEEDVKSFYITNFTLVYKIFLDTMHYLDGNVKNKKGNKNISTSETVGLSKLILALFKYNRDIIKKKWQQRSIVQYIEIYLEQGNAFPIRKSGYEMLLGFLDILQEEADPKLLDLLLNTVDFSKHLKETDGIQLPNFEVRNLSSTEKFRLQKATYTLTEDESLQLFSLIFEQITNSDESFLFWLGFFKHNLAPILYPVACKNLQLIDLSVMVGFSKCPPKLHGVVVDTFLNMLSDPKKRAQIYSSHENLRLMFSLFKDAFAYLPPEKYPVLNEILDVYYTWMQINLKQLNNSNSSTAGTSTSNSANEQPPAIERPSLIDEDINGYYSTMIESVTLVFDLSGSSASWDIHIKMSYEILKNLQAISLENHSEKVLIELYQAFISIFKYIMKRKSSENKYDLEYSSTMERIALRHLLVFWIKTHPDDSYDNIWQQLYELYQTHFEDEVVFEFWKVVVLELTNEIIIRQFELPANLLPNSQALCADQIDVQQRGKKIKIATSSSQYPLQQDFKELSTETILYLWHRFLWLYGVEKEKNKCSSNLHIQQISVISEIVNRFLSISHTQVEVAKGSKLPPFVHSPEGNTLVSLFMDKLVEACLRSDEDFIEGRCIAFSTLCKILCEKYSQDFPQATLSKFYTVIHHGLVARSVPIIRSIILSSWNLFSLGHKGSTILLPYYVQACEFILLTRSNPEDLKMAAINCLCSVISLCYFYENASIPMLESIEDEDRIYNYYSYIGIRRKICEIFLPTVEDGTYEKCQIRAIWGLFMITYKSLTTNDDLDITVIIETILSIIFDDKEAVAFAAHDFFTSLSHLQLVGYLDYEQMSLIIRHFCHGTKQNLCQPFISYFGTPNSKARTVTHLLYTIVEYIIEVPPSLLQMSPVSEPLFDTITLAIDISDQFRNDQINGTPKRKQSTSGKDGIGIILTPIEEAELIKIAAEVLLSFILNSVNNFPTLSSASQMSSSITEFNLLEEVDGNYVPSPKIQHFLLNNFSIMTVMQSPDDAETARIIVRDMSGRYCWDHKLILTNSASTFVKSVEHSDLPSNSSVSNDPEKDDSIISSSNSVELNSSADGTQLDISANGEMSMKANEDTASLEEARATSLLESYSEIKYPHFHSSIDTDRSDMLQILQAYITEVFPESKHFEAASKKPIEEQWIGNAPITAKMRERHENDSILLEGENWKKFQTATQPKKIVHNPDSIFNPFRRFLSNIGLLDTQTRPRFSRLVNDHRFYLSLSHLDQLSEREAIKVGVVYVKNQQEKQTEILKNDSASNIFNEFCLSLGWEVDLKSHKGFIGKLETDGSTGDTVPYFANVTTEVVFHIVPWMPTKPEDDVQLVKKRHVGNDFVHIIWSEHDRAYRPWTLPSQFNFVHIIIYPLNDLLFRIQIFSKEKCSGTIIPEIGPLQDGMIVDKLSLGPLVRQTAVNANKACRYNQAGYKKPYLTRRDLVNEIIEKFKPKHQTSEEFNVEFFKISS